VIYAGLAFRKHAFHKKLLSVVVSVRSSCRCAAMRLLARFSLRRNKGRFLLVIEDCCAVVRFAYVSGYSVPGGQLSRAWHQKHRTQLAMRIWSS
jgi:hypothetical protein